MKELIKNLKFVWRYSKDQKWRMVGYVLVNILWGVTSIIAPILSAKVIVYLTTNEFLQLILVAGVIFVNEMLSNVSMYYIRLMSSKIYRETYTKIQIDLGNEILKLDNKTLDKNGSGVFIQRMTSDTSRIAEIFNVLTDNITDVVTSFGALVAIIYINKYAFIFMLLMIAVAYYIEFNRVKKQNEKDKLFRKANEKVSGFIGEIVRGSRDIKMLNAETSFLSSLEEKIVGVNNLTYDMRKVNRNYRLLDGFVSDLTDLLLIVLLIYLISHSIILSTSALIIYNYSNRCRYLVYQIGAIFERIKDFNLSSTRIFNIIESDEFSKEKFGNVHLDKVNGNFEFKDVSFKYEKGKVLNGLSFKIKENETVAFVGKSGAGKTTIFSLICKMYEPTKGKIYIEGKDITTLDKDSIRGNITIINQSPYIFNLTIRENLQLVKKNLTTKEMKEACKIACLDKFIETLPDKYDTLLGEGGVNLSGGQKQRLAIARALIQKTEIILFDEATSALDNETQRDIQKAIDNMKKDYTILIIAHRLSTIKNCDRILFLEDGKIVAEGNHKYLLNNCDEYKNLYESEIEKDD